MTVDAKYIVSGQNPPHSYTSVETSIEDAVREAMRFETGTDFRQQVRIAREPGTDGRRFDEIPTYHRLLALVAKATAYTFGPSYDRSISLIRFPDSNRWRIYRGPDAQGGVWDGEVWEYRGQTEWAFNAGWTECERIVAANIWPVGNVRPWEEKL
jgi:hypothetical protein